MTGKRYLDLDLPEHFMLQIKTEQGEWWEQAVCRADQFARLDDDTYICRSVGSPIWLRCVEKHRDHIVHVDGTGKRFEYRLLAVEPDGRITLPEGGELLPRNFRESAG